MAVTRRESDAIAMCLMDVLESIKSGLYVAIGRTMIVGREEGVNRRKIRLMQIGVDRLAVTRRESDAVIVC